VQIKTLLLTLTFVFLAFSVSGTAAAAAPVIVSDDDSSLNFPDTITFQAVITAEAPVRAITLEYGANNLTCGEVVAKAFPPFSPANTITPSWTWEMKQSGSLPPGAVIWWRWRYHDINNKEYVSEQKTITWLDDYHDWQTITSGYVNLHWYSGSQSFAQDLLAAAGTGLARLQKDAGLIPEKPINLYIYASTEDMKDAILYEPSWTGGMAYPEYDIVIIGLSPSDLDWGRSTIAHELTHVLVGHLTFSCLGDVPTWLNEGLAVYSEGSLNPASQEQLDQAIRGDQLLSVRSLSAGFSEVPSRAYLSYSQSYSIVKFLVETYGREKMNSLLIALRNGATIDDALYEIYGFDIEGLESAWRESVGAAPRVLSAQPTAQPTPTFVPTFLPFTGASLAVTPTPYFVPTSSSADTGSASDRASPPLSLTIALAVFCCMLFLLLGVIILGFLLAAQKRKGGHDGTK